MQSLTMRFTSKEEIEAKLCLVCAPSLCKAFEEDYGYEVTCLDIDRRFEYLKGFRYFDL